MERDYEKYSIKITCLTAVELASAALALLLVIFILFVPYFCKTTVEEILGAEEFKSFDEYFLYLKQFTPQELMRGEHVTSKSYSMFEELTFLFKNYRLANDKDGLLSTKLMTVMIFPFSAVVMGIIILVINGKTLYDRITDLVHPEKSVMLKYDELQKSSAGSVLLKIGKGYLIYVMLVSYFGTLMYAKMFEDLDSELTNYSHIIGMDKVSGFFSVTVAIAVVYIVIAGIGKVLKKNLKTEIVSAKYDDVGSGAFDYSRSPRPGYGQNNQGAQGYGNPPQSNLRSILSRPTLSPGIINPISRVIISPTVRSPHSQTEQSIEGQLRECYDFARRNKFLLF